MVCPEALTTGLLHITATNSRNVPIMMETSRMSSHAKQRYSNSCSAVMPSLTDGVFSRSSGERISSCVLSIVSALGVIPLPEAGKIVPICATAQSDKSERRTNAFVCFEVIARSAVRSVRTTPREDRYAAQPDCRTE